MIDVVIDRGKKNFFLKVVFIVQGIDSQFLPLQFKWLR